MVRTSGDLFRTAVVFAVLAAGPVEVFFGTLSAYAQFPAGGRGAPPSPGGGGYRPPSAPGGFRQPTVPSSRPAQQPRWSGQSSRPGFPSGTPATPSQPSVPGISGRSQPGYPVPSTPGQGFRNPLVPSRPPIPGAPTGLVPGTSRFFPRPAVPVPTTFQRVYVSPTIVPGSSPNGAWADVQRLASAGQAGQAKQMIEQRLAGHRDLAGLFGAVNALQHSSQSGSLMADYRKEALQLARTEVHAGAQVPLPYVVMAKYSLESGNEADFRTAASAMMTRFPNDQHSHLFDGLQKLKDHRYKEAESSLRRAQELGIPLSDINQYLKLAIDGQKWVWEYAEILALLLAVWAVGLLTITLVGKVLSALSLRSARKALTVGRDDVSSTERWLRRCYRWMISIAGGYYYISLPMVSLLAIMLPLAIGYALLMLPSISIFLVVLVFVAAPAGILTAFSGMRAIWTQFGHDSDPGRALTAEEAPGLWSLLTDVAAQLKTRPVDEVWLMPGTTLAVIERGRWLQRLRDRGRRALLLGAGVLDGFRIQSFQSVLAHEYGHFINRDTAGGDVALRVRTSMQAFAERILERGPIRWWDVAVHFLKFYHRMFMSLSFGASRLQEILADRVAVRQFGATAFSDGLRHVIRRTVEFDVHMDAILRDRIHGAAAATGFYQPDHDFDIDDYDGIDAAVKAILADTGQAQNTHPAPADRLAMAERIDATVTSLSDEFVPELFTDPDQVKQEMSAILESYVQEEADRTRQILELLIEQVDAAARWDRSPQALFERASLNARLGNFEHVRTDLQQLLPTAPDHPEVHLGLVVASEELGDFAAAVDSMKVVMKADRAASSDFGFVYRLGRLQVAAGQAEEALITLQKARSINDATAGVCLAMGRALLQLGKRDEATTEFRRAVQLAPDCPDARTGLVELSLKAD
ncbi:MAG: tetratricopeptide repeat protein [Planctomycetaceae bacterium]